MYVDWPLLECEGGGVNFLYRLAAGASMIKTRLDKTVSKAFCTLYLIRRAITEWIREGESG